MSKIIFVGGIHGVGKGTLCQRISQNLKIHTFSAGEIIKKGKDLEEKGVQKVDSNQNILLEGLKIIFQQTDTILLDGHFVLITNNGEISRIPLKTFEEIAPVAIVILEDDPQKVGERLFKRDGKQYSLTLLQQLQDEEIAYSNEISNTLKIPYLRLHVQQNTENIDSTLCKFILTNI